MGVVMHATVFHRTFSTVETYAPTLSAVAQGVATACMLCAALHAQAQQNNATAGEQLPIILEADTLNGEMEGLTVLEGQALLEQGVLRIEADKLEYNQQTQQAKASGNVQVRRDDERISGSEIRYDMRSREGEVDQPQFSFKDSRGKGEANKLNILADGRLRAHDVRYTTCECEDGHKPAWELRADSLTVNREENEGYAKQAHLRFYDTPILGVPAISFPVTDARKSGWLPPTLSIDSVSGVGWKQPYYWNIAPNYDATFYPTLMTKRGLNMGSEFRYLGTNYDGKVLLDYLANDRLRNGADRWGFQLKHDWDIDLPVQRITPYDHLTFHAQANRVSDNSYWRDFSDSAWTKRFLPNELRLTGDYGNWSARAQLLKWQTQQLQDSLVDVPYDRLPQLDLTYGKQDGIGWDYELGAQWVSFKGDSVQRQQPDGDRGRLFAQASYLYDQGLWQLKPSVRLDHTRYWLDAPLRAGGRKHITRTVPTFSLDASMQFERSMTLRGNGYTQTLEPRALYVYTPYRDQSDIPNFETAQNTFNFASIFADTAYTGHDRKADNNSLTLGATSRFISDSDGSEKLKLAFAQRIRFDKQRVVLPGEQQEDAGWSDMLFGADVRLSDSWSTDGVVQYNPEQGHSDRIAWNWSYHPAPFKVVNFGYRFQRDRNEYLDASWQWPLRDTFKRSGSTDNEPGLLDNWYSVGRINYSQRENKVTDSLIGFEYDGACWVGRIVVQRNQTGSRSTKKIMAQLEFTGLSSIGTDPLDTLKKNIERYQRIRYDRAN